MRLSNRAKIAVPSAGVNDAANAGQNVGLNAEASAGLTARLIAVNRPNAVNAAQTHKATGAHAAPIVKSAAANVVVNVGQNVVPKGALNAGPIVWIAGANAAQTESSAAVIAEQTALTGAAGQAQQIASIAGVNAGRIA